MIITKLRLQNFRGYQKQDFEFLGKNTLFVGPNTVGKTNILEAIYLLASGKSFRAGLESEMITWEKEVGRVKGEVRNENEKTDLEIVLTKGEVGGEKVAKKKFLVNGIARRMQDFLGHLRAVYFRPEDLDLVSGSPSLRRRYLDAVLGQVDREYVRSSLSYEKGLRQRNKLLEKIRDENISRSQLLFWDQLLIKNGNYLTAKREEYLEFCNQEQKTSERQQGILDYSLEYDKSVISPSRLEEYAIEEVAAASTLVGPHRDDFCFVLKKRDLHAYGSRGEQRLGVLWLKLAELEFITLKTNQRPVLLLDDIFSELDEERRSLVLALLSKQQTMITTTDLAQVKDDKLQDLEVIRLT